MKLWHMLDLTYALVSGDHERLVAGNGHFYVAQVEVMGDPPNSAATFLVNDMRDQTVHLAERVPHVGKPVVLRLQFSELHIENRKDHPNPKTDPKMVQVTGAVFSANGDIELGRTAIAFPYDFIKDDRKNGVTNATVMNNQKQRNVDMQAAADMLERVYGSTDWDRFMNP